MLFAVEGGGFFSSSASGYSKGLTLLLLGQKTEEKPMRVTPWNQYQLVDQETDPDFQLASGKKRPVRGCASFGCFRRNAPVIESPSPLKVGPTQNQDVLPEPPPVFDKSKDPKVSAGCIVVVDDNDDDDDDSKRSIVSLKSSLKKASNSGPIASTGSAGDGGKNNECESVCEKDAAAACETERRKVQWTDTMGGELFEIREFEMSEYGSDDDFGHGSEQTCSCRIM